MTDALLEERERKQTLELLMRWAEQEHVKLQGRAMKIPQATFKWEYQARGLASGFYPVSEGVCSIPSTNRRDTHTITDEFGVCFRQLEAEEQAIILLEHLGEWALHPRDGLGVFGEERAWMIFLNTCRTRGKYYQTRYRKSWTNLSNAWRRRRRDYRLTQALQES